MNKLINLKIYVLGLDVMYSADGHIHTSNYGIKLLQLFPSKHPVSLIVIIILCYFFKDVLHSI